MEDEVGQLFVVEVFGRAADEVSPGNQLYYGVDTPADVIAKYRPGGVIYFDARRGPDNLRDPQQIAELSAGLQRASAVPLLIGIDQEGGSAVARLGPPATAMPGAMALAAGRDPADARRSAHVIGSELAALGITMTFAPVADVNVNPANPVIGVRSPGADPELVAAMVAAQVDGFHDAGIAAVAKHFPGHGDTTVDSHFGLPTVTHDRAELDAIDLPPFRAAIRHGVDAVMSGHLVLRSVDPSGAPATLSRPILTGLLREELGFDGVIVTDALDMRGVTAGYPPDVAPVAAFLAGADLLVLAPEHDTAYAAMLAAVRRGTVTPERLDASVRRIQELKNRAWTKEPAPGDVEQEITDRTTTLLSNTGVLPASPRSVLVTGWGPVTTAALGAAIGRRGVAVTVRADATPDDAAGHDLVVVTTIDADDSEAAVVHRLVAAGVPVVVASVRNPYDAARFPGAAACLATYGHTPAQLESLTRVLFGEIAPAGKLPVTVPSADGGVLYPIGHGLTY